MSSTNTVIAYSHEFKPLSDPPVSLPTLKAALVLRCADQLPDAMRGISLCWPVFRLCSASPAELQPKPRQFLVVYMADCAETFGSYILGPRKLYYALLCCSLCSVCQWIAGTLLDHLICNLCQTFFLVSASSKAAMA